MIQLTNLSLSPIKKSQSKTYTTAIYGIISLLLNLIPLNIFAQKNSSELLIKVDEAIANAQVYTQAREQRIMHLKERIRYAKEFSEEAYNLNSQLFDEYKKYICDSALHYQNQNIIVAQHLHDTFKEYESKINMANLMGSTGMYKEGIDLMETIDTLKLSNELLVNYLYTYLHIYDELAFYTQDKESSQRYWGLGGKYEHKLKQVIDKKNDIYLQLIEDSVRNAGKFDDAIKLNDIWLSHISKGTPEYALATFHRSIIYQWAGKIEEQKYYLALSAISDIESANKDQASLRMLAQALFEEGDIDRAYNYIRFSWNTTVFYNAKLRTLQTASILSLIDKTYQAKIEKQKAKLQVYLILISSLTLIIIAALLIIFKQMKRLSAAKIKLQQANDDLNALNKQLSNLNQELTGLNKILNETNNNLSESNKIKEVYIGRFIELCSIYINKIDDFRKNIHNKIKTGKIQEAQIMSQTQDIMDEEFEELYTNFDNAFLQLFPNFVEKVNSLLNEDDKIILKKDELLNPELRIMALMRLGGTHAIGYKRWKQNFTIPTLLANNSLQLQNKDKKQNLPQQRRVR